MQLAQGLSTLIYLIYIGLLSYVFARSSIALDETAIIDAMEIVAPHPTASAGGSGPQCAA